MRRPFDNGIIYGENLAKALMNENPRLMNTEYNATKHFQRIISQKGAVYMEVPMKNGSLGYTEADDLGVSVTINSNIDNMERKNFTIAHEIGHLLFHVSESKVFQSYLETNNTIQISQNGSIKEMEANAFAAHLILPDSVLRNQILSSMNAFHIKKISGISIEALKWRISDYLKNYRDFPSKEANDMAEDFTKEFTNERASNTALYYELKDYINIKPTLRSKNSRWFTSSF
jgi:Zn-dependent peptidase ImmA (M78 family)